MFLAALAPFTDSVWLIHLTRTRQAISRLMVTFFGDYASVAWTGRHGTANVRQFGSHRFVDASLLGSVAPEAALASRENKPFPSPQRAPGSNAAADGELGGILANLGIDVSFEQISVGIFGKHQSGKHRPRIEVDVPGLSRSRVADEVMTRSVDTCGLFQALIFEARWTRLAGLCVLLRLLEIGEDRLETCFGDTCAGCSS